MLANPRDAFRGQSRSPNMVSFDRALGSCGAVYCNRSCLWVCDSGRADGRAGDVRTLL